MASPTVPPGSDCSLTIDGAKKKAVGEYIARLGPELRKRHGHHKHYTPQQVRQTAADTGMQFDYLCFAYCLYCSPSDFALIHAAAGEACDYEAMHAAISSTFFQGADFDGPGLADLLFSVTGGAADAASAFAEAIGSIAGTAGDVAGSVLSGLGEILGSIDLG